MLCDEVLYFLTAEPLRRRLGLLVTCVPASAGLTKMHHDEYNIFVMTNIPQKPKDGYVQQSELYKALAHPVRLSILDVLSRQEACVCHLTALLHQRQPYISQHLAILRAANLVADRREGTIIYYRIRHAELAELLAHGRQVWASEGPEPPDALRAMPDGPVPDCPCPRCQPT
jgi:DNA-binding transcriptional ArsR family regulator